MAITTAFLASGNLGPATSQTLAPVTLTANRLQFLILRSSIAAGSASVPTIADVGGRHWVPVASMLIPGNLTLRLSVFATMAATTDASVQVVVDYGGVAHSLRYGLSEADGVNTSGSNGSGAMGATATNTGIGTAASTSQSFASASNGCMAAIDLNVQFGMTAEAGWTQLFQSGSCCLGMWRADNDTTPSATVANSTGWAMFSMELIAAPPAGASPPPVADVNPGSGIPPQQVAQVLPASADARVQYANASVDVAAWRNSVEVN